MCANGGPHILCTRADRASICAATRNRHKKTAENPNKHRRGFSQMEGTEAGKGLLSDAEAASFLLDREQQVLEECERHLRDEQQRLDAAKDRLEWLTRTLGSVRAGVQHLADKLQHMPLTKHPGPQLTPDSEEYVLQLLSDAEQKMMLLKEDLQGKDLATVMKEMEENEFQASMEEKLPQQNTRIQLPEAQKLDLFDDEKERAEDEVDVVTRATLKHQSQLIIDAKNKRRTRVKKSKD